MRILQVTPYFAPAWAYGGPPRVMTDYAVGLTALGHQVDVFTTDVLDAKHRAAPAVQTIEGVRVRRFRNLSNDLAWKTKKYLPLGLPPALARAAGRYDAIHVTDVRTFLTASAHLASSARRVPLILSAHGSLPGSSGLRGAVKDAYDVALVRRMLRRAALLLAQTAHEAELYQDFGGRSETIRLLPLPLSPIDLDLKSIRGSFRAKIGVDDDERLLLFLGRINRLKGLDVLIESVQPLLGDGTSLAVVGRDDGQLAEISSRFGELIADGRVRLTGPLYDDDRFAAYVDADVFCLTPPHWEETSVATLEAAACGTAVVVSEQADLPGLAAAGGGFVVPLDRRSISGAVSAALSDSAAIGARARSHVLAQHDRDGVVARLDGLLRSLI
jgi:glycosyltransferase involved in cell wall biosynthesis